MNEGSYGWRGLSLKSKAAFIEQHQRDVEFKVLLHFCLNICVQLPFSLLEKGTMFEEQSMGFYLYFFFTQNLAPVQNYCNSTVLIRKVMVLYQHWESCRLLSLLAIVPSLPHPVIICGYISVTTLFQQRIFSVSTLNFLSQGLWM